MSKDYANNRFKRTSRQPRGASTNILWLIIGVLSGILLANLGIDYIKEQITLLLQKSKRPALVREAVPAKVEPEKQNKEKEKEAVTEDKVNFDFYTILPNSGTTTPPPSKSAPPPVNNKSAAPAPAAALPTPEIKVASAPAPAPIPKPIPKVVENKKPPVKSEQANYILQISSFRKIEEADQLKAQLTLMGLEAKIKKTTLDGMTWYRVWLGVYPSLAAAEKAQKQLQAKQIKGVLARVK